jgi:D-alanine-D-alanine ligase
MKVLVLLGGNSPEREVSLRSGAAVAAAAKHNRHEVFTYDPAQGYAGLDDFIGKVEVVLPIMHGVGSEDGEIQRELEERGFKFLGSDSKVSKLCFDKVRLKEKIIELGFKTPGSEVVNRASFKNSELAKRPYVLKPIEGGSSLDTFIVRDVNKGVDPAVFEKYEEMLLEELVEGIEITVPVLGEKALPVIEIIPPQGKEFDYENKYNGATQEICPPKNVPSESQQQAQAIAEKMHTATGARHLSRTDIIIDKNHDFYVLELNTIPGLTDQSLFPKSAAVAGITFEQLVDRFIQMAAAM